MDDEIPLCDTNIQCGGNVIPGRSFERSVLMKRQPANVIRRQAFRCDPAFRNETHSYETIVPIMSEFAGWAMPFPDCHHASSQLIVLQDLQPLGFKMADRKKGLDMEHSELAMKALARFHGTSLAMKHVDRVKFEGIRSLTTELAFAPDSEPVFGASVENALRMALTALEDESSAGESWSTSWELGEALHNLRTLKGSVFRRLQALTRPTEPLSVLCHGDLWLNNMLFRYNGDAVEEVKFVDLQVMRYSSLATDLLYFLSTSVEPSVLRFHQEDLVSIYHEALVETVSKLAPDAPKITIEQINDQIEELALFGLLMGFLLLPAITVEGSAIAASLENIQEDSDVTSKLEQHDKNFLTDRYQERVRGLVLHFVNMGYI
uniref:Citrate synthase, mitochondrial n=1 Tax=Lygus hesperus TaxID=30085 RepID=A0A0A9VYS8_LYGHE